MENIFDIKGRLFAALVVFAVSASISQAGYVNFTGLTNSGGTFSTDVNGDPVPTVTVDALSGTGTGITQSVGSPASGPFPAGSLFRLQDLAPIDSLTNTMVASMTFSTISVFNVVASTTNSNISAYGELTVSFRALKADLTGFSWNLTGLTNGTSAISGPNNSIITFTPSSTTLFTAFNLAPNFALDGIEVTVTSRDATSSLNSAQFAVDMAVIPEPSTIASLLAAGLACLAYRNRCRRLG